MHVMVYPCKWLWKGGGISLNEGKWLYYFNMLVTENHNFFFIILRLIFACIKDKTKRFRRPGFKNLDSSLRRLGSRELRLQFSLCFKIIKLGLY